MERRLYDSLMAQASEANLAAMTLGLASEPLLRADIADLIAAAIRAGVMDIRLGTNGRALTPKIISALLDSGLTRLEISVDAVDSAAYAAIRPGGDLEALERAIERFLDERSRRNLDLPLLRLSFLRLPQNEGQLEPFMERWADLVDLLSIQKPIWFPDSALPEPPAAPKAESGWCAQPWQRLGLDHQGHLWPCCSWYGEGLLDLSAVQTSIAAAWRSQAMEDLRASHVRGDLPGPCRHCAERGAF
jgi:hypothetical protein